MPPILLHIYGPIAIHSFGAMIVLGLIVTLYLLHKDKPLQKLISQDQLATIFQLSFVAGIAGGRIWFLLINQSMIEHWTDCFMVWAGGLSILGAIVAILGTLTGYFYYTKLPALPILDRITLYTPLLQSISRCGCFFAGCCFGKPSNLPWAVMYEHYDSLAPLHMSIHPTQLYSSLFLLYNFLILLCFDRYRSASLKKAGLLSALYMILMSLERFLVDFLRGDQEFLANSEIFGNLSIHQAAALCIFIVALSVFIYLSIYKKADESI